MVGTYPRSMGQPATDFLLRGSLKFGFTFFSELSFPWFRSGFRGGKRAAPHLVRFLYQGFSQRRMGVWDPGGFRVVGIQTVGG